MNTAQPPKAIRVWDLPIRVFHWSLVTCFFIAYLTEDDFITLHSYAGYTILGLIVLRLLWGIIGTKHARFSDFAQSPRTILNYLQQVIAFKARRYLGHNPAGGAMVLMLLLTLSLTSLTGLATYAVEQSSGPLVGFMSTLPAYITKAAEELHELLANFTLLLILLHVVGVLLASYQHAENLIRAMFTGQKRPLNSEASE